MNGGERQRGSKNKGATKDRNFFRIPMIAKASRPEFEEVARFGHRRLLASRADRRKIAGVEGHGPGGRLLRLPAFGTVAFDAIDLADQTPFPEIGRARRFRCSACGERDFAIAPEWRGYRALGMGAPRGGKRPEASALGEVAWQHDLQRAASLSFG